MIEPVYTTEHGKLYQGDCIEFMEGQSPEQFDVIFADPPFNLNKEYGRKVNDKLSDEEYLEWTYRWLDLCVPLLREGGALWVYNLPKWNIMSGAHLMGNEELTFRHQVAVSMKSSLPIKNKLYPAHYSLLYFIKGKRPKSFTKVRTPYERCRHCGGFIKDYGGHIKKMNPEGVNLTDVWTDLSPVRHKKTKFRKANALPEKMLDRVLTVSGFEGATVFDPFGGSGTTYAVAEQKHLNWVGIELGDVEPIIARLQGGKVDNVMPNLGSASPVRGQRGLLPEGQEDTGRLF
ncbi:DNA-methyltransferase [Corynebacterium cystitidis]|uniref:Methyltransferase n=1 Tax=Corynebacterium cystitidis DSM 20524 TaxID=1121357 RepID=A0A1H9WMR2_9CORY|nr:site-specific DNA-methyltransferase [Corynebacterium cystitidis]WJY82837.1 Modification methylase BamHI [Corynebacterium cystitidis DSM 20524]SES35059.1 site-specific DNA-methyltransferase (adenine-specific) [Corynebacterium cystitidis DSM 20524]SNV69975.1 DNA restriction-modification system, DNA methylase [Corynebacterium cystitidis]